MEELSMWDKDSIETSEPSEIHVNQRTEEARRINYIKQQEELHQPDLNQYETNQLNVLEGDHDLEECTITPHEEDHNLNNVQFFHKTSNDKSYKSMMAKLGLETKNGEKCIEAIVDSGAAWCAIRASYLKEKYPEAMDQIQKKQLIFRDASNNQMPLLGSVLLNLKLKSLTMPCTVFVFESLGAPFLLGTNALYENELIIDPSKGQLCSHKCAECVPLDVGTRHADTKIMCTSCNLPTTKWNASREGHCLNANIDGNFQKINCFNLTNDVDYSTQMKGAELIVKESLTIKGGKRGIVALTYSKEPLVDATTVEVNVHPHFQATNPNLKTVATYHNTMNVHTFIPVKNSSSKAITIPAGTVMALATFLKKKQANTRSEMQQKQEVTNEELLFQNQFQINSDSNSYFGPTELETKLRREIGQYFVELDDEKSKLPFEEGGSPKSIEDIAKLLNLEESVDPTKPLGNGQYEPLSSEQKKTLYEIALRWWWVFSREAKTPDVSRIITLKIPTGDAPPISQRPYNVPYALHDAVKKEIKTLLDAGLIEPSISSWASPTLVIRKKDSTPENIMIKLVIDYRRLNEVTVPHNASLGTQEELIDKMGGKQIWRALTDAAGGFYQFPIAPEDRPKTAFVLPIALGCTQYQWVVAPYGLTRNPAGYSTAIMFTIKDLDSILLAPLGLSIGGILSWIDDLNVHADSFIGFCDLFERLLARLAHAGISLKPSKCEILLAILKILGFIITPDGIKMQIEKLDGLKARGIPRTPKEVKTFMGAVTFYKRFIPRISLLAAPMNGMLKKEGNTPTEKELSDSFHAILSYLRSDAIVALPDLADPLAEYVICTDACDISVGGVLMQWQHPTGAGPGPPDNVPIRGEKGKDPIHQSWRLDYDWTLKVISYYSKTLNPAQRKYAIFEKEAAAVYLCAKHWRNYITCRYTTVYTDSTVAKSMTSGNVTEDTSPRLQRWGHTLGTFYPYLKLGYRKGIDNGMADFLCRYPTFSEYIPEPLEQQISLPEEEHTVLIGSTPLFSHAIEESTDSPPIGYQYKLYDVSNNIPNIIWQRTEEMQEHTTALLAKITAYDQGVQASSEGDRIPVSTFYREQRIFDDMMQHYSLYVKTFVNTYDRPPVVYDLFCCEGGMSRGFRDAGYEVYGFEINDKFQDYYITDPNPHGGRHPSLMTFMNCDCNSDTFWHEMNTKGCYQELPIPDVINAGPPCQGHSRLGKISHELANKLSNKRGEELLSKTITKLQTLTQQFKQLFHRQLIWTVENVPESEKNILAQFQDLYSMKLCGTMMGHRVFRHRIIYSNADLTPEMEHSHEGKIVGTNGARINKIIDHYKFHHLPPPNMYGVYSWRWNDRGTNDDWHGAMGYPPLTFSEKGLTQAVPHSYGRYIGIKTIVQLLHREYKIPIFKPSAQEWELLSLQDWSIRGYNPTSTLTANQPTSEFQSMNYVTEILNDIPTINNYTEDNQLLTVDSIEEIHNHPNCNQPFSVTREDQLCDPKLRFIIDTLEKTRIIAGRQLHKLELKYSIHNGLLCRYVVAGDGEIGKVIVVPDSHQASLLTLAHHSMEVGHRGHRPLLHWLKTRYYWDGMDRHVLVYCLECVKCGSVKNRVFNRALLEKIPTPARPFESLALDFKGVLRRSGIYTSILIIVCMLTRFVLLIPVENQESITVLRVLTSRVFCVFGYPKIIVSDNGPAFKGISAEAEKYIGIRHIHILPYNAKANQAEAHVKRVKTFLDLHTFEYNGWHKLLPMMMFTLNQDEGNFHELKPFVALFGREATSLSNLELPLTESDTTDGATFVRELRKQQERSWALLQESSDRIRSNNIDRQNVRAFGDSTLDGRSGFDTIRPGDHVWVRIQSKEKAQYIAKHGHGKPWQYKYEVLEATPTAVRLKIPKDKSAPAIQEWQSVTKVAKANKPSIAATLTHHQNEYGQLIDDHIPVSNPMSDDIEDTDTWYEIDDILMAKQVGDDWILSVKWKGYRSPTWEPYSSLYKDATPLIREHIEREIIKARSTEPSHKEVQQPLTTVADPVSLEEDTYDSYQPYIPPSPTIVPAKRNRTKVVRFEPDGGTSFLGRVFTLD